MTVTKQDSEYRSGAVISDDLVALHGDLERMGVVPGWHRPAPAMWAEPRPECLPMHRSYAQAHEALTKAGDLVDTAMSERRNLILANTESDSQYGATKTHVLAYQMILPGERARTHRHAAHAGRLVLDSDGGAYTVVDGTRIFMESGDVLLTPGGCWHGHAHEGSTAAYWLDFLDVPLVQLLEPMFFEPYPEGDWMEPERDDQGSPFLFPWSATREHLAGADAGGPLGASVELPAPSMPTIGLGMHQLAGSAWTPLYQSTANYEFCVVEGTGASRIGDVEMRWERGDVVVAPCWTTQQHRADDGAVLFSVTDAPLQRYCGYLRERTSF